MVDFLRLKAYYIYCRPGLYFLQLGDTFEVSYLQAIFTSKGFKLYIQLYTEDYKLQYNYKLLRD